MNKKIIVMFIGALMLISSFASLSVANELNLLEDAFEKIVSSDESANQTYISIGGCLAPSIDLVDIEISNCSFTEKLLLNLVLERGFFQLLFPLVVLILTDMDFTITFKEDMPTSLLYGNLSYFTGILEDVEDENLSEDSIFNETHTVTLEGFNGGFVFLRAKPLRGIPATFAFAGTFEKMAITK